MTLQKFRPILKRLKREVLEEQAALRSTGLVRPRAGVTLDGQCPRLKSPHPFPAKMGMDIVWAALKEEEKERRSAARLNAAPSHAEKNL
jgi:hypothetical protein